MIKGKIAGLAFGGLAGYLLISKTLNTIGGSVKCICDASKWKAYYKNNKDPLSVPPGYASGVRKIDDENELVIENPKNRKPEKNASQEELSAQIAEAVKGAINSWLKGEKAPEGAKKDETEASEDEDIDENEKIREVEDSLEDEISEVDKNETVD